MSAHNLVQKAEEIAGQVQGLRAGTSDLVLELQDLILQLRKHTDSLNDREQGLAVMPAEALAVKTESAQEPYPERDITLIQAIENFIEGSQSPEGADCPCCSRHYEAKRLWFNASHARALIHLVRYTLEEMEHNRKSFGSREVAKRLEDDGYPWFPTSVLPRSTRRGRLGEQVRFGVIELTGKRTKQMWRVTPRGVAFVEGKASIPTAVLHIGPVTLRLDSRKDIKTALQGTQRSYDYEDCLTEPLFKFPENEEENETSDD